MTTKQAATRTAREAHATTQATARDADRELRRAGEGSAA